MGGAAMRGSSEDLLAIRSRGNRGSLPFKKFSPVSHGIKLLFFSFACHVKALCNVCIESGR